MVKGSIVVIMLTIFFLAIITAVIGRQTYDCEVGKRGKARTIISTLGQPAIVCVDAEGRLL